jgi:hypothetical protein
MAENALNMTPKKNTLTRRDGFAIKVGSAKSCILKAEVIAVNVFVALNLLNQLEHFFEDGEWRNEILEAAVSQWKSFEAKQGRPVGGAPPKAVRAIGVLTLV